MHPADNERLLGGSTTNGQKRFDRNGAISYFFEEPLKIVDVREDCESKDEGLLQLANLFAIALIGKRSDVSEARFVRSSKVKSYAPHVFHYVFDLQLIWK